MRRAARVDANHAEIVAALRKIGATARSLAAVGQGVPDLLVGFRGRNLLLEVKNGAQDVNKQALTADEKAFFDSWAGQAVVVRTVDEALRVVLEAGRPGPTAPTQDVTSSRPGDL